MERRFANVVQDRDQTRQKPGIQRWMWMSSHIDHLPQKRIADMVWMQRIDLRVFRAVQVIYVVTLNGLVEERNPQTQYQHSDQK